MAALDQRIADLAQVKKALLICLESVEQEIQDLYRLRYAALQPAMCTDFTCYFDAPHREH